MEKVLHILSLMLLIIGVGGVIYSDGLSVWQLFMLPVFLFGIFKLAEIGKGRP